MKRMIHPKVNKITARCSCNNVVEIYSTLEGDLNLDVCNACHPFYTGKERSTDVGGRVGLFKSRFRNIKAWG